jgi:aspartate/methionine/tyrosine aminotransferase
MAPFLAMEVMERARVLEREGRSILHLGVGEPDFDPPPAAISACRDALARGATGYTDSLGLPELREAIARDKAARCGVAVDPEQVIVTSGTSPAMLMVFSLLLEPGAELIVPAPHYPCYPNFAAFRGAVPVPVATDPEQGWAVDPDAVRAALTPRTRAIIVGSPANPTGAIQPREVMQALAALGVPLVSDEIYDGLVFEGATTSALEVADEPYVLDGFSKRYAMTGFRLGYAIAPRAAMRTLQTLQQSLFISASEFVQHAGLAALREGAGTVATAVTAYRRRRDLLVSGLRELGFRVPQAPPGAFYVFADARRFGSDSRALAGRLLEEAGVAVTPGVDFGAAGEGFLRICVAAPEDVLREALERMAPVLERQGA